MKMIEILRRMHNNEISVEDAISVIEQEVPIEPMKVEQEHLRALAYIVSNLIREAEAKKVKRETAKDFIGYVKVFTRRRMENGKTLFIEPHDGKFFLDNVVAIVLYEVLEKVDDVLVEGTERTVLDCVLAS